MCMARSLMYSCTVLKYVGQAVTEAFSDHQKTAEQSRHKIAVENTSITKHEKRLGLAKTVYKHRIRPHIS